MNGVIVKTLVFEAIVIVADESPAAFVAAACVFYVVLLVERTHYSAYSLRSSLISRCFLVLPPLLPIATRRELPVLVARMVVLVEAAP